MHKAEKLSLIALALLAFAGNSLLCRVALKGGAIDAASFTSVRLVSGAMLLFAVLAWQQGRRGQSQATPRLPGDNRSAMALFVYASAFSWAYLSMSAATGALLLFGAVQVTMIAFGLFRGERLLALQWAGLLLAVAGVIWLVLPGLAAPPLLACVAMLLAGIAWGVYSLRGGRKGLKGAPSPHPTAVTAGNFLRAIPLALGVSLITWTQQHWSVQGLLYALASGALTSGLGYAIWYRVLPYLPATHAATVQLGVPALAAFGGMVLLGESMTWTLAGASAAILGGIALVMWGRATPG